MELDPKMQRRNLMVLSLGLLAFEIAGGKLATDKLQLNFGITFSHPDVLLSSAYLVLAYFLWRYWLYARPEHQKFRELVADTISNSDGYQKLTSGYILSFKSNSDYTRLERQNKRNAKVQGAKIVPISFESFIQRGFRTHKLVMRVEIHHDSPIFRDETKDISLIRYEYVVLKTRLSVVIGNKAFSDLFVPYIPALLVFGIYFYNRLLHSHTA